MRPGRAGYREPEVFSGEPPGISGATRFPACQVCFPLVRHVLCPLVLAKSQINRMPHLAGTGPLCELHLRNELRLDPRRNGLVFRFLSERRLRGLQLDQLAMQLFEDVMAKARADMADVAPAVAFPQGQGKSTEERPRAPWRGDEPPPN